jgi:hypothetical protein
MTSQVCESTVEEAALQWFDGLGYDISNGPGIAPGEPAAEGSEEMLAGRRPGAIWHASCVILLVVGDDCEVAVNGRAV